MVGVDGGSGYFREYRTAILGRLTLWLTADEMPVDGSFFPFYLQHRFGLQIGTIAVADAQPCRKTL